MPNTDTVKLANAAKLLMEYEKRPLKADEFLDSQYSFFYKYGEERRVCQFIFLTVLRNKLLIDTILAVFLKKMPRPGLFSVLKCACAEIISAREDKIAQTVHSWVEVSKKICSQGESKLANAVLRKFSQKYSEICSNAKTLEDFALLYSHPLWIAKSWQAQFGFEKAVRIMRKNQEPSEVFLRVQNTPKAKKELQKYSEFLCESEFENFYKPRMLPKHKKLSRYAFRLHSRPRHKIRPDAFKSAKIGKDFRPLRRAGGQKPNDCRPRKAEKSRRIFGRHPACERRFKFSAP